MMRAGLLVGTACAALVTSGTALAQSAPVGGAQAGPAAAVDPVTGAVPRLFGRIDGPPRAVLDPPMASADDDRVLFEADDVVTDEATGGVEARGQVVARSQGRTIRADRLLYDPGTGTVTVFGNVTLVERDGSVTYAQELVVDDQLESGIIRDFSARLEGGGVIAARAAVRREGARNLLSGVIYTACPVCEDGGSPTWEIRARRALQDQNAGTIAYNDVVLAVAGVPVGYVPWFAHGDPTAGRESGFLQALPARSSRLGLNVEIPYLIVLDRHSDLTLTPVIAEQVNPLVQAEYRRSFHSGDLLLTGSGTREAFFGRNGVRSGQTDWRGHLFGQGLFRIDQHWNWGFGIETASDDLYLLRYGIAGAERQRGLVRAQPSRLLSQLFVQGQGPSYYVRGLAVAMQDLIPGARRQNTPRALPLVEARGWMPMGPMGGQLEGRFGALVLNRQQNRFDSATATGSLRWRAGTVVGPGLVVEPHALVRADVFAYENLAPGQTLSGAGSDRFARSTALAALDIRWPLQRLSGAASFTLEPRVSLVAATRDSDAGRLSAEQGVGFELDSAALFRPDASEAADQWAGGSHVTIGLTAGARLGEATRITWFAGRRFQSEDDPWRDRASNLDRAGGDWVSDVSMELGERFALSARARVDAETGELVRAEIESRLSVWRLDLSARYQEAAAGVYGPDRGARQIQGLVEARITRNWGVFANIWHDLESGEDLVSRVGATYTDECTEVRVFYEHLNQTNRFIEPSDSIRIQVALRTLGVLDRQPYE